MPLPFIIGAVAALAAAGGIGSGIHGASKMIDANDTMKTADSRHQRNINRFKKTDAATKETMDKLSAMELDILNSFEDFSNTIEKIQNRPKFKKYKKDGVKLPEYDGETLKKVSIGAGVLLGGLGGAAVGTAGGIAASGATTTAVAALGAASTGTAITSLSGIAATNATMATLGGGALAAGGGGIALGTTVLGAATLGVGLLVGGVIFNVTGNNLSDKADEAWDQMKKAEKTINLICEYLDSLRSAAVKYSQSITTVRDKYQKTFEWVSFLVNDLNTTDWNDFSQDDKIATENAVLLVGLLYKMCKVNLVNKSTNDSDMDTVNETGVDESINNADSVLNNLSYA